MPLHKRKPVDLINNPVDVNQNDCNVFYIDSTSEIFLDYALVSLLYMSTFILKLVTLDLIYQDYSF